MITAKPYQVGPLWEFFVPGSPAAIRRLACFLLPAFLLCGLEVFSEAARITDTWGKVEVKHQDSQEWLRVEGARTIKAGDSVKTNWRGKARMYLEDGSRVDVGNSSSVTLDADGAEYSRDFKHEMSGALRLGYTTHNKDVDGLKGIAAGAGMRYSRLMFDFAWVPFGDLGNTFRYTISAKF